MDVTKKMVFAFGFIALLLISSAKAKCTVKNNSSKDIVIKPLLDVDVSIPLRVDASADLSALQLNVVITNVATGQTSGVVTLPNASIVVVVDGVIQGMSYKQEMSIEYPWEVVILAYWLRYSNSGTFWKSDSLLDAQSLSAVKLKAAHGDGDVWMYKRALTLTERSVALPAWLGKLVGPTVGVTSSRYMEDSVVDITNRSMEIYTDNNNKKDVSMGMAMSVQRKCVIAAHRVNLDWTVVRHEAAVAVAVAAAARPSHSFSLNHSSGLIRTGSADKIERLWLNRVQESAAKDLQQINGLCCSRLMRELETNDEYEIIKKLIPANHNYEYSCCGLDRALLHELLTAHSSRMWMTTCIGTDD